MPDLDLDGAMSMEAIEAHAIVGYNHILALIARVRELERAVSALKQDFPGGVVTVQTGLPVDDGDPLLVAVAAERKRCAGTVGGAYSDTTE